MSCLKQNLLAPILPLITLLLAGCADTSFYNLQTPAASQANQYVEAEGLSQIPSKTIAITSFGIEYDTKVVYPLRSCHGYQLPGGIYTVRHFQKEITFDISNDRMQLLADTAYTKLVMDLKAAGYHVMPYETYKETPAYQSLIEIVGKESPVSITFKHGDPENLIDGEALVFAPTDLVWYSPPFGEVGSRVGDTLTSLGSEILYARRGFSGGQAVTNAEVDLADALNATLLKVYYVVSPVRSHVETKYQGGAMPVEGQTIVGSGETRLAFRTPGASRMQPTFSKKKPPVDGNAFVRLKKDVQLDTALKSNQDIENYLDAVREMLMTKLKAGK
jgi:hypothetical protein